MTITTDTPPVLAHGYTVADLDTLARKAASTSLWRVPYFAERRDLGVPMGTAMPRFWKYWSSASQPALSPEEAIVEVTALAQICPRLTRPHRAVLAALATYDDYEQAAAALNKPYHSFVSSVSLARKQVLRLWHQHETPRPAWGRDIRSNHRGENHHSVTVVTIRHRERRRRATNAEATR